MGSGREAVPPFLRWPGGKRWLTPTMQKVIGGGQYSRYFEPFLGGGAMFFALQIKPAILSDVNGDLIDTYKAVRGSSQEVVRRLRRLRVDVQAFRSISTSRPKDVVGRAVRLLYLNRVAFSGIYRVNRFGQFNVPFGGDRKLDALWRDGRLSIAATALKGQVTLTCSDFEESISEAGRGDLVYCDPTYNVTHAENGFRRYNEKYFTWADQERLARVAQAAAARGATVVLSNAHFLPLRDLYPGAKIRVVERVSTVARDPKARAPVKEYLFVLRNGE